MKKYSTSYQTKQLKQKINRILNFTPRVKIRKLDNGSVQVNNFHINNVHGEWKVAGNYFYRRKSAVGYALCLIKQNKSTAEQVYEADRKLLKIKSDIDIYYYHMQRSKNGRKITMSNRISADMPRLYEADAQLTQLLKTISV